MVGSVRFSLAKHVKFWVGAFPWWGVQQLGLDGIAGRDRSGGKHVDQDEFGTTKYQSMDGVSKDKMQSVVGGCGRVKQGSVCRGRKEGGKRSSWTVLAFHPSRDQASQGVPPHHLFIALFFLAPPLDLLTTFSPHPHSAQGIQLSATIRLPECV